MVDGDGMGDQGTPPAEQGGSGRANDGTALELADAVRAALSEFSSLTGRDPDAVTGIRPTEDGWSVLVDVEELTRIPATTSILATYRVDIGPHGDLCSYERLRRYTRGATDPL